MTNFEKIASSPEALVEALKRNGNLCVCHICAKDGWPPCGGDCAEGILEWLKAPHEESDSWAKVYKTIEDIFTASFMRGRVEAVTLMELPARIEALREAENDCS